MPVRVEQHCVPPLTFRGGEEKVNDLTEVVVVVDMPDGFGERIQSRFGQGRREHEEQCERARQGPVSPHWWTRSWSLRVGNRNRIRPKSRCLLSPRYLI